MTFLEKIVFSFEVSWVHISYILAYILDSLLSWLYYLIKLGMEMELSCFVIFSISCCSICLIIFLEKMLCTKALGYKILSNVCIQTLFFDVKTFQSPNHRYNGSYVNIYADEQMWNYSM